MGQNCNFCVDRKRSSEQQMGDGGFMTENRRNRIERRNTNNDQINQKNERLWNDTDDENINFAQTNNNGEDNIKREKKLENLLNKMEALIQGAEKRSAPGSNVGDQYMLRMEQLMLRYDIATAAGGSVPAAQSQTLTQFKKSAVQEIKAQGGQVVLSTGSTTEANGNIQAATGNVYDQQYKQACFGKVSALMAVCKEINNDGVTGCCNLYINVLRSQSAVFNTMTMCAKPADLSFMVQIAKDNKQDMVEFEKKNRKYTTHIRCVQDSLNLFAWFQIPDGEEDAYLFTLADFFGAIDFMGAKLQSDDLDKKWFRAFREVQKDFYEFIKNNYPHVLQWSGTNTNAKEQYFALLEGKITAPVPKQQTPVKKLPLIAPKTPVAAPKAKPSTTKSPAIKQPSKVQKGSFWEVSNYINDDIVFEEDDIYAGMTLNFFNCEKCNVTIPGKFKNFMMNKCKRMELNIDSCVSMGEVIKCENIKLYIENTVPQVSIELSNGVQIFSTLNSKNKISLMTTASQSVSFTCPKDPGTFDPNNEEHDPNKTEVVPETFCSKFVKGKLTTVAEEGGFD